TTILPTRDIMTLFLKRSLYASWTQNLLHYPPDACPTPDASRVAAVNDHLCWPCQTWSDYRRCFKAVDSMSDEEPKLIAIDEEANHQIVHSDRFGKANGATYKPFNPGPQIDVLTFDFLRILLPHRVLLWGDMPLVRPPSIGVKPCDTKRL